jgi:molybdopterin synthase catalytic subunit
LVVVYLLYGTIWAFIYEHITNRLIYKDVASMADEELRQILREIRELNKKEECLVTVEIYHILGRIMAGSTVLAIGKYILNVWGG